jgi:hypothetical protein
MAQEGSDMDWVAQPLRKHHLVALTRFDALAIQFVNLLYKRVALRFVTKHPNQELNHQ